MILSVELQNTFQKPDAQRTIANILFVLLHRHPKASELASVEVEFDRNLFRLFTMKLVVVRMWLSAAHGAQRMRLPISETIPGSEP